MATTKVALTQGAYVLIATGSGAMVQNISVGNIYVKYDTAVGDPTDPGHVVESLRHGKDPETIHFPLMTAENLYARSNDATGDVIVSTVDV